MARAYIGVSLEDDLRLRGLRDEIYNSIGSPSYYRKKEPHITVIPPFTVSEEDKKIVEDAAEDTQLIGRQVQCNSLAVWRNINSPKVVMLDVDVKIEDERRRISQELIDNGIEDFPEPVRPHITLFKKYSLNVGIPEKVKHKIQLEIADRNRFPNTTILDLYVEFKEEN